MFSNSRALEGKEQQGLGPSAREECRLLSGRQEGGVFRALPSHLLWILGSSGCDRTLARIAEIQVEDRILGEPPAWRLVSRYLPKHRLGVVLRYDEGPERGAPYEAPGRPAYGEQAYINPGQRPTAPERPRMYPTPASPLSPGLSKPLHLPLSLEDRQPPFPFLSPNAEPATPCVSRSPPSPIRKRHPHRQRVTNPTHQSGN